MRIRPATIEDATGIARVHVASWRTTYRGIVPDKTLASLSLEQRAEMWSRGLVNPARKHLTVVAEAEEQIVGFADYGPSRDDDASHASGELYAIYLLADFQRRGLGGRLWRKILAEAHRLAVPVIYVWVLAENHSAKGFYNQCGFRPDGAQKAIELGGKRLNEIRCRLDLT